MSLAQKRQRTGEEVIKCVAFSCNTCKERRIKQENNAVNIVKDETIVNLFDKYKVVSAKNGELVIVLDPQAPVSLTGRLWLNEYLAELIYRIEDMVTSPCH